MSKIQLFIASSLDGYIADKNGSLDWLMHFPNPQKLDYGYNDLIKSVDTIIMGRSTYEEILKFGMDWPYDDYQTYIVTNNADYACKTKNTSSINRVDSHFMQKIKANSNKNIWLVGGGQVIKTFQELDAIDELTISIIPICLGSGIKLFPNSDKQQRYTLKKVEPFETGVVNLHYIK